LTAFISFKEMTDAMRRDLREDFVGNLQFASVVALTRTAMRCRDAMKDQHMPKAFDRPTPYALNAARAVPATAKTMASAVLLREFGSKGTPAEYFLGPEIDAAPRRQKREERAFSAAGVFQGMGFVVPGDHADIDAYGNETPAEIRKIMSVLRVFGEQGYKANRTKGWSKATRVGQIFVVRAGGNRRGLKPGVYRRTASGGVECLQKFVRKRPTYRVRLPFDDLVLADAARIMPEELDKAIGVDWAAKKVAAK
jgi:hypothetical protein